MLQAIRSFIDLCRAMFEPDEIEDDEYWDDSYHMDPLVRRDDINPQR